MPPRLSSPSTGSHVAAIACCVRSTSIRRPSAGFPASSTASQYEATSAKRSSPTIRRPPQTYSTRFRSTVSGTGKPCASAPVFRSSPCSWPDEPTTYRSPRCTSTAGVALTPQVPHSEADSSAPTYCVQSCAPVSAEKAVTLPPSSAAYTISVPSTGAATGEAAIHPSSGADQRRTRLGAVAALMVAEVPAFVSWSSKPYESHAVSVGCSGAGVVVVIGFGLGLGFGLGFEACFFGFGLGFAFGFGFVRAGFPCGTGSR